MVDNITGSVTIVDYGQQLITIYVSGGKEPYHYELVGNEPVYSGSLGGRAIQLTLNKKQFIYDGQVYKVWITVKDANGQTATWKGADGSLQTRFVFGYKYDPGKKDAAGKWITQPSWVIFTEPKFPY